MSDRFVYVMYIDTSPTRLWEALTRPEFTEQYWGGRRIQSDWMPGSPIRHMRPDGSVDWSGEVIEAREPEFLSYTFDPVGSGDAVGSGATRVSFRLEPYGETVRLTVVHEGLEPGAKGYRTAADGWAAILSSLKSLLERGEPLSYPWTG